MDGAFAGISYGGVALIVLLVITLGLVASPLLAAVVGLGVAVFLLIGMAALRLPRAER
jgi:hypothetical protein